jgi:hypothetical protein
VALAAYTIAGICGLISVLLGSAAILSHMFHVESITGFGTPVVMSPSTGFGFIVVGVAILKLALAKK